MAFPIVKNTGAQTVTTNSTSWGYSYPTGIAAGDLLVVVFGVDGTANPTPTEITRLGWTSLGGVVVSSAVYLQVFGKICTGTESGAETIGLGASEQGGIISLVIGDWYGSGIHDSLVSLQGTGTAAASTGAVSANPNPPALNPTNWDIEDTLWIIAFAVDTSRTFSAFPANYTVNGLQAVSGGSGGATAAVSWRTAAAASEDPGTATISASDDWGAMTLAIRPAVAALPRTPFYRPQVHYLAH
jgi:hypothetical protein